jgi:uncharacterized C2H2 Zn-finger protein
MRVVGVCSIKHDYIVMEYSIISEEEVSIVYCNICKEKQIVDKIEEWYKEHNKKHKYIPNYKNDKKRVYCLICKESCYPSLNGKMPESKIELDLWYNNHSSLFHKNEELIPIDISKIEERKEDIIERLYKCDICNALYREKSNIEKHLKYLHGINDKDIEPIEIDFKDNERRELVLNSKTVIESKFNDLIKQYNQIKGKRFVMIGLGEEEGKEGIYV